MSDGQTPGEAAGDKPSIVQQLRANPWLPLAFGIAAAVAVLAGLLLWSQSPNYGVLFSGLSDRDGGDIIAALDQMQEPYKFAANGSTILIPSADVDRVRLKLAGQGLPKGGGVGFELMDKEPFGISRFAEHVNYNRALSGELARSIETIDAVASARVNLAIPQSSVFVRERKKPTASVVLKLYHNRALAAGQVGAIQHLVAASVPRLPADSVTVVDGAGHLLSGTGGSGAGADGARLKYVARVEAAYRKRIRDLLAPIVGPDNVRAQVVADVDFSADEHTQETYAPNENPDQATIRSEQHHENRSHGGAGLGGVPGALSNRPSPTPPSPINNPRPAAQKTNGRRGGGNNARSGLKMAKAGGLATGNGSAKGSATSSSTINYEVNRRIEHVKQPIGRIRRISAAVVINDLGAATAGQAPTKTKDQAKTQDAGFSAARMAQLKALVRGAIGYSAARGDSVELVNLPFAQAGDVKTPPRPPWWRNRRLLPLATKLFKYLLVAVVAWLLWRKLVKPLLERAPELFPARAAGPEIAADNSDNSDNVLRQQRRQQQGALMDTTRGAARDDPRMVAMIVKNWMNGGG